jgi:DNA-binding NtrC family response regulator
MADPGMSESRNTVLVVDDEIAVLRVASATLAAAGFQVAVAGDGAAGLQMYHELRHEICLVLCDVVMPVLGGIGVAEKILKRDPGMSVLLMSGYSEIAEEVQARHQFPFIRKPFLPADLVRRIRRLLGRAAAAQ